MGKIGAVVLALLLIVGVVCTLMCTTTIEAGYVGVQYSMNGGIMDDVLNQGWHVVAPWINITKYTTALEQSYLTRGRDGDSRDDESFAAASKEGKDLTIELAFNYQYDINYIPEIFKTFKGQSGTEIRDNFVKPNIKSWTKEVISKYGVAEIIGDKRAEINGAINDYLAGRFAQYHILISNVTMSNIDVDANTSQAINAKIQAEQEAARQKIENQRAIDKAAADAAVKTTEAQAKADANLIAVEAEAKAKLIAAEGEAAAIAAKASAQAEANKEIANSLTPELLEQNRFTVMYEAWAAGGAQVPVIMSGDGANTNGMFFDISSLLAQNAVNNVE